MEALILFIGLSIVSTIGVAILLYQHIRQNRLTKIGIKKQSQAITMFYPFEIKIPNESTIEALNEDVSNNKAYSSVEVLMEDLDSDKNE